MRNKKMFVENGKTKGSASRRPLKLQLFRVLIIVGYSLAANDLKKSRITFY